MKHLLLIAALLALGCEGIGYDLDGVTLVTADMGNLDADAEPGDMPADSGDIDPDGQDMDVPDDTDLASMDMADASDADASDGGGALCQIPLGVDPDRCNPTQTGECPGGGFCTLAVAAAPPPELLCVMRALEGEGDVGTACTAVSDCAEGLTCVDWGLRDADPRPKACARFCELETNVGCEANEFCTTAGSQPPLEGIGYCTPRCDPYDASACPSGQTCNVDFNFPVGTCEPNFRCVLVEDFVAEGGECGPGRMVASCAEDLICYEVQIGDFRCVAPCQADADCGGVTCLEPQGDWELRYCEQ